jgi:small GTP-binding protein
LLRQGEIVGVESIMSENSNESKGHHVAHFHFKPPPDYTGHDMTEPLDLSKIKLGNVDPVRVIFDGNETGNVEDDDDEMNEEEEERFTRGRSRSRSVHSCDDGGSSYPYGSNNHGAPPVYNSNVVSANEVDSTEGSENPSGSADEEGGKSSVNSLAASGERTGPLQHREVIALQKGLEEAHQQTLNKSSREDEEERMAADAEKRKRMLAANHQASSSANEPFKRFKLLLLGDSAVGKSSLILRWTMDTFSANLTSTVGVNFKSRKVQCYGEWIQVQVWDTSGQENFHKITTSYYRGAQGIMLVYDVTEKKSLENVTYWIKNIKAHASESVQIVLVGNKIDLRDGSSSIEGKSIVTTEMGRQVAQKFGVPFF